MANEFKVKNGLIVVGDLTTSGTITINGALAATQSWVSSQSYLTSANLSSYATQSYVTSAIASLVNSAPAALDTLNELAAALGNDASFSTTVTNSIASKLSLSGGTMTGQILFQTASLTNGFRWNVNSDAAGITFKNTGDGDNNSYFNFFTEDNGNEYFKFSHNTWNIGSFDFMDVKNGVVRTNGDIYVNASQSGTRSAGTNELINGSRVWHSGDFSSTNVSNWNTAYSWGNHAGLYAASSHTHSATDITSGTISSARLSGSYAIDISGLSSSSNTLTREDNRTISPSELAAGQLKFGFTSWTNDNGGPYADFLHLRSYTDASGGDDNLVMFKKSGIGMRIWQQTWGSTTPYSSYADVWTTVNFTQTNVNNWNTSYGWGNHASAGYVSTSGSYANPSWITSLAYSKITGVPAFLTAESDTLNSVTGRGNTTGNAITTGGLNSTADYSLQVDSGSTNVRMGRFKFIRSTYNPTGVSASIDFWRGGSAYEGMLAFSTNGGTIGDTSVERMRITDVGNIGIGTTTPTYNLEVSSTGYTGFGIMSGANSNAEISFQNRGYGLPRWTIRAIGTPDGSSGSLTFQRLASNFLLTLTSGENVLIGTSVDNGYKLDVNGTGIFRDNLKLATGVLSFDSVTSYWGNSIKYESGQIRIYQSGDIHAAFGGGTITLKGNTNITTSGGTNVLLAYSSYVQAWQTFYVSQSGGTHNFVVSNASSGGNAYFNNVNVGIGTTTPSAKFEVYGADNTSSIKLSFPSGNTLNTYTGIVFSGESPKAGILFASNAAGYARGSLIFATSSSNDYTGINLTHEKMRITDTGNVGIGTVSPSTKLDVSGVITATGGNSTNWNTSYSWGNHASAGYQSASTAITTSNIGSQSVSYASTAGSANSVSWTNVSGRPTNVSSFTNDSGYYVNGTANTVNAFAVGYSTTNYDFTLAPRQSIGAMSIKLWDNYFNGSGLGSDYGSLLDIYGRVSHVHSQFYMDASGGIWYRMASYSSGWSAWEKFITSNNYTTYTATAAQGTKADTAYSWGNHSSAGYQAAATAITTSNIGSQSVSYASSSGSATNSNNTYRAFIEDTRSAQRTPNNYEDYKTSWEFTNQIAGLSGWRSVMTMQGWHDGYAAWQIIGGSDTSTSDDWYLRSGNVTTWNSVRRIWHSGDFTSTNVSNWNTAFGWGNHASAGYLTSTSLSGYATTSYVTTQINNLISGAPGALDTLDELAAALGDDSNFATTVTNSIAGKVSKGGDTITGNLNVVGNIYSTTSLGIILNSADAPLITRGWDSFTSGAYNGIGRWGLFMEPSTLVLGTPNIAGNGQVAFRRFNADGTSVTTLLVNNVGTTIYGNLTVGGTITENSSIKLKENVETSEGNLEKVVNLRPVTYNKIGSETAELGLIAEEVAQVYPEFVQYDENGEPIGVHYSRLTAALIGAVKQLTKRIETLENNG